MSLFLAWLGDPIGSAKLYLMPVSDLTLNPNAAVWDSAASTTVKMVPQDLVTPKLLVPSVPEIQVRGMSDGTNIAVRLEWQDATLDDRPVSGSFVDACAMQVPAVTEASVPVVAMGQPARPVDITFWRADWQAIVDGREDSISALFPNASIDHYNAKAKPLDKNSAAQTEFGLREAPARAVQPGRSGPRAEPVEDLIGMGPADLRPAAISVSKGRGIRTASGWAVVLSRPAPKGFSSSKPINIAFAVWEGSHDEVGSRKMRSAWVSLMMTDLRR
ncbi:MAG: hypothetical protein IPM59_08830 [Chloracidobacterium sp.]|nr:hypothetical protein [Chloracidobacterium sp.]